jgi:hypothetical protein
MICEPNYISLLNKVGAHYPWSKQNVISYKGAEVSPSAFFNPSQHTGTNEFIILSQIN